MRNLLNILSGLAFAIIIASCGNDAKQPSDTLSTGTLIISADETYKPIIDEQIRVFDSSFPDAKIIVHYKPESECIKDLMNDSVMMVLVTRDLSADEKAVLESNKRVPYSLAVAKDAMTVIVNNANPDSVFSKSQLKGILTGVYSKKYTVVFDNQGSSTVRYVTDSLIPGEKLGANVFAAKGNDSVIDYVSRNPDAIGFLGVSYVSNYNDPEGLAFIKNVKVLSIFNDKKMTDYKPYQAYIAPDDYQLTRNLYYIHDQTYPGIAVGFANFLAKERGQLIFKQARLFPLRMNIIFRSASINQ